MCTDVLVTVETGRNAYLACECGEIAVVTSLAVEDTAVGGVEVETIDACEALEIGEASKAGSQARFTGICEVVWVVSTWAKEHACFVVYVIRTHAAQTTCIGHTCRTR